ncbi:AMP nucleosidase [Kaistia algarum]|uniref:AMP nucleosidase n=1 Tax=Kaistia algarum TaxID=2083279 RepID=UPI000CE86D41|nr:AMP nucleosidase [Kaistia algarum]MCX5515143.1 AMP nucleosidase [Kaistia algarum]PPE80010.1 AMP nucleosidase [Kaistia algarum]
MTAEPERDIAAFDLPEPIPTESFTDPVKAVRRLEEIYDAHTAHLRSSFDALLHGRPPKGRVRATYPEIGIRTTSYAHIDSRLAYGHVSGPGDYATTITQPSLFRNYLTEQIRLLLRNHGVPVAVGPSNLPIPLHFAFPNGVHVEGELAERIERPLRDMFDVPDLAVTDDAIANGTYVAPPGTPLPLAPFTAPRIDYSLFRLSHYTATDAEHFQNFVLFTNYQFYIDEFCVRARRLMAEGGGGYDAFVEPGNLMTPAGSSEPISGRAPPRLPQMPAYHLKLGNSTGITMVNIGVGPSNAKTITDHVAVLRPHAWLMLGHCAGLRNSQKLGDYVLAHGYVREDHVLDADLPNWIPIPPLAEVQVALEDAVEEVTGLEGYDLKRIMRTGTVATIDNRNWELRDHREPVQRFSQSRAVALDMESATIAANGFRFRVPYGTLLCVSDKPLHGELKLPGMASEFYRTQVGQHLEIGIRALEMLRQMAPERLHSRKLRSFTETAFQ